jgi:hypothetical protein
MVRHAIVTISTVREIQFLGGKGAAAPVPQRDVQPGAPEQMDDDDAIELPF